MLGTEKNRGGAWSGKRTAVAVILALGCVACYAMAQDAESTNDSSAQELPVADAIGEKQIIGATAKVVVTAADVSFNARVDTGAQSTSLHVEEMEIEGASEDKRENWGKKIRFRVQNKKGATAWIESKIDRTVIVKTSEQHDRRYKVPLELRWGKLKKKVLVTLNDRSGMNYPVLLGRDFLRGDLLVDVERNDENEEVADEKTDGEGA